MGFVIICATIGFFIGIIYAIIDDWGYFTIKDIRIEDFYCSFYMAIVGAVIASIIYIIGGIVFIDSNPIALNTTEISLAHNNIIVATVNDDNFYLTTSDNNCTEFKSFDLTSVEVIKVDSIKEAKIITIEYAHPNRICRFFFAEFYNHKYQIYLPESSCSFIT